MSTDKTFKNAGTKPDGYTLLGAVNPDDLESELVKRGWAEDRDMSGRYISPHTKITYKIEQACRIEDLL